MILVALALAFFVGSIPFGVLIGKICGVDVRSVGSGNIGATNVWRILGPKWGSLAFFLDLSKGLAGPFLAQMLAPDVQWGLAACGLAALMGHVFSPLLGFKGGKGIATGLGALLGLMTIPAALAFVIWAVVLGLSRMISAASVVACLALPFLALGFQQPPLHIAVATLMSAVALIKHIPNLKRIAAGVEPKVRR